MGLNGVTIATLANELGVKAPSLYNHVDGRDDIIAGITRRGAVDLARVLTEATANRQGTDAIRSVCVAYRRFAAARPGTYDATQLAVTEEADPVTYEALASVVAVVAEPLADVGVASDRIIDAVRTVRAMLHGFVLLERNSGFGMPQDVDSSFDFAVESMLRGLTDRS